MMVCLDRDTGPVHPAVCSAAPSTGRIGISLSVTTRILLSPAVLRVHVSASRTRARTVPQILPTRKPHTPSQPPPPPLGNVGRVVALVRPPEVCVPVCAAGRRGPPGCPPLQRCALPALHLAAPACPPAPQGMGQLVTLLPSRSRTSGLRILKFISIMVCCASHERRHHRWPVYGSPMCRLAPQNSCI